MIKEETDSIEYSDILVRLGWEFNPRTINGVAKFLEQLGKIADNAWRNGMECGYFPNEDISPAEGFRKAAKIIREKEKTNGRN